jgi:hypothetical protein
MCDYILNELELETSKERSRLNNQIVDGKSNVQFDVK